jgi:signal transduction histidine kinase
VAGTCKAAVAFNDSEDAKETLNSLRVHSSIVYGGIYDEDGNLIAAYYRHGEDKRVQPESLSIKGYEFSKNYLTVFEKIILDGEVIGTVCIRSDLGPLYSMLSDSVKIVLAIMLISLAVAFLLSSRLQNVVSSPILNLAGLAKAVSEQRDYAVRGVKTSNDEIGFLIDAFNEMLEQIQDRDRALVGANTQLEAKVTERTADLEQTVDKLNKSNQQLQEFTYIASHDLREPLRKISSFGQLLTASIGDKLEADDKENLNFMIDGANRMQQMVEALLTYSRVTTKGVAFEPVDLNTVVKELTELELAVKIEETHTVVEVPEKLHTINADPVQMRQLIQNLIANGIKYQKKDSIPKITIRTNTAENGMIKVQVADNGIGIPENQYKNVFVMFKRLHTKQEYEGTGIGLAVCKKIVERHNGEIGVESVYGEGSTFWFTVPTVTAVPEEAPMPITSA